QIQTADACVATFALTRYGDERLQTAIAWHPEPPYRETVQVILQRTARAGGATVQAITGDVWRSLEGHDLEDEFLDRVLMGGDVQAITADLLAAEITHPDGDLLISRVSNENGFDDYDVKGHPKVHRLTVGHGIRKGDMFNLY